MQNIENCGCRLINWVVQSIPYIINSKQAWWTEHCSIWPGKTQLREPTFIWARAAQGTHWHHWRRWWSGTHHATLTVESTLGCRVGFPWYFDILWAIKSHNLKIIWAIDDIHWYIHKSRVVIINKWKCQTLWVWFMIGCFWVSLLFFLEQLVFLSESTHFCC